MTIKAILMDLDGTVYRGSELINGALESINYIRNNNYNLFFFTNNSEKNRLQIAKKLIDMGIDCKEDDIISSGFVASSYILKKGYSKVYLAGSDSLREEFIKNRIELVEEEDAETIVIGMDTSFDYLKMKHALNAAIRSKVIIACNMEMNYPCGAGKICPGNGAIVSSILFAAGKVVSDIIGKPNSPMFDYVVDHTGLDHKEILVVGDTYTSDVCLADRCGAPSVLIGNNPHAKLCISSISELPNLLEKIIKIEDHSE